MKKSLLLFILSFLYIMPLKAVSTEELLLHKKSHELSIEDADFKTRIANFTESEKSDILNRLELKLSHQGIPSSYDHFQELFPEFSQFDVKEKFDQNQAEIYIILKLAQNGYLDLAQRQIDKFYTKWNGQILQIEKSVKNLDIDYKEKTKLLTAILTTQMEWALVALGPVTEVESARVVHILNAFEPKEAVRSQTYFAPFTFRSKEASYREEAIYSLYYINRGMLFIFYPWFLSLKGFENYLNFNIAITTSVGLEIFYYLKLKFSNRSLYFKNVLTEFANKFANFKLKVNLAQITGHADTSSNELFLHNTSASQSEHEPVLPPYKLEYYVNGFHKKLAKDTKKIILNWELPETAAFYDEEEQKKFEVQAHDILSYNKELQKVAQSGAEFRNKYLELLNSSFKNLRADLLIDPLATIFNQLHKTQNNLAIKVEKDLTFLQAQRRAWEMTQDKFGLHSMDLQDVEDLSLQKPEYQSVLNAFEAQVIYQLNQTHIEVNPQIADPRVFKLKARYEIEELRAQNLKATANIAQKIKNTKIKLESEDQPSIKISTQELASAQIELISLGEASESLLQNPYLISKKSRLARIAVWARKQFKNHFVFRSGLEPEKFKAIYITQESEKLGSQSYFHIQSVEHDFIVSAETLNELLQKIRPTFENVSGDSVEKRFVIEGPKRDQILTQASLFVTETLDRDLESLGARIENKIEVERKSTADNVSLSEHLRDFTRLKFNSKMMDLFWGGLEKHPLYLKAREQTSKTAIAIEANESLSQKKKDKALISLIKKEELRDTPLKTKFTKSLALAAGVAAIIPTSFFVPQLIDGPVLPNFVDLIGFKFNDTETLEDQISSYNVDQTSSSFQKNSDKELYRLEFFNNASNPSYFNLIHSGFLTPNKNLNKLDSASTEIFDPTERHSDEKNYLELRDSLRSQKNTEKMIRVSSFVRSNAKNSIIPILTPQNYKLEALEITDSSHASATLPRGQYKIFKHQQSQLYYIQLKPNVDRYFARFTYEAIWSEHKSSPSVDTFKEQIGNTILNKDKLKKLQNELVKLGALELSAKLNSAIESPEDITINKLEHLYATSGIYRFTGKTQFHFPTQSTFDSYRKFLQDGVFHYQCTGSNNLFVDSLNYYFSISHEPILVAAQVRGYRLDSGNIIFGKMSHLHSMVINSDYNGIIQELDATPFAQEPRDGSSGGEPKKIPKENDSQDSILKEFRKMLAEAYANFMNEIDQMLDHASSNNKQSKNTKTPTTEALLRRRLEIVEGDATHDDESRKSVFEKPNNNPKIKTSEILKKLKQQQEFLEAQLQKQNSPILKSTPHYQLEGLEILALYHPTYEWILNPQNTTKYLRELLSIQYGMTGRKLSTQEQNFLNQKLDSEIKVHSGLIEEAISSSLNQIFIRYTKTKQAHIEQLKNSSYQQLQKENSNYLSDPSLQSAIEAQQKFVLHALSNHTQFVPLKCENLFKF